MQLSTQTKFFVRSLGYIGGVEKLCGLGYDCLDLTLTHLAKNDDDPLLGDNWRELALTIRRTAEKHGVYFNQSHAPYRFKNKDFIGDPTARDDILFRTKRSIEIAGVVGAKAIVVHPLHHRNFNGNSPEFFFNINMDFYGELAETAIKSGVKIAVENMWQRNIYTDRIVADVCSNPHELARYVDALNERHGCFIACLDIGHCALTGVKPEDSIRVLGSRLGALHVHDNDTLSDGHLLPFMGKIDFIPVMQALKEIGYTGELTFEADKFLKLFPEAYAEAAAEFMYKTGRYLISLTKKQ